MYMRIIPALAGNTLPASLLMCSNRDHPRACGEHEHRAVTPPVTQGSSPRLRGTPQCRLSRPLSIGIIPALAGNTTGCVVWATYPWDHPRACGEHFPVGQPERGRQGSSPRLRGTHGCRPTSAVRRGIIPALAGNTKSTSPIALHNWDHPRACGEHVTIPADAILTAGSSPRLRGTPDNHARNGRTGGIIPALAGNTFAVVAPHVPHWDHPRACGEHANSNNSKRSPPPSSPRLRGTPGLP